MTSELRVAVTPSAGDERLTDDERLMRLVAQGDRDACRRLVQGYQRLVAMIAGRMVRGEADRQELCQEVFLRVCENAGAFRSEAKLSTWIGRIATNACINHLRKKRIPLFTDIAGGEPAAMENMPGAEPSPEQVAEQQDLGRILQREMERLGPVQRMVLGLFHGQGMSYEEIGRITGLPAGTVKSHLFRARQKLRERLHGALARGET